MTDLEAKVTERVAQAMALMGEERFDEALALLDDCLQQSLLPRERGEILGYRSIVLERMGRLDAARADLQALLDVMEPDEPGRYSAEQTLAELWGQLGATEKARGFRVAALRTALRIGTGMGAGAVVGLLGESDDESSLSSEERRLCEAVVNMAWARYGLAGSPDLTQLRRAAEQVLAVEYGVTAQ